MADGVGMAHARATATWRWQKGRAEVIRRRGNGKSAWKRRAKTNANATPGEGPAEDETQTRKRNLLQMVGNTSRGKRTTNEKKRDILNAMMDMERMNPTDKPARNPMLSGQWSLLYYAAADEQTEAKAGEVEGPFLSFFKPLLGRLFRTKSNSQNIDVENGRVENIAEFATAFGVEGVLNIQGTVQIVSDTRAEVVFDRFVLKLGKLSVTVPLSWVSPSGYVDTTYLDDTIRIGRGDKGSIFLNARRQN